MKLDVLEDFGAKYDAYLEILPKKSDTVIVTGKADKISDVKRKDVLDELKKIKAVYNKEETNGGEFTLFKAGVKVFLDNTFIYYEHYLTDYSLSTEKICDQLQKKKKLAKGHLTNILSALNKKKGATVTSLAILKLDEKRQQEIIGTIKGDGGIELQNIQDEKHKKFCFNIYLSNDEVLFTSTHNWKACHNGIRSFVYSIRGELPNPNPSISNVELVQLVKRAHEEFLRKCNILSVEVLREQNKTIIKRVLLPIYIFVLPLLITIIYMGLITKNFLGICSALGIFSVIGFALFWLWKSTSKI